MEKQLPLPEWAAGKGGWLVGVCWTDYSAPDGQRSPCVPHEHLAAECTCFPSWLPVRFCVSTVYRQACPALCACCLGVGGAGGCPQLAAEGGSSLGFAVDA